LDWYHLFCVVLVSFVLCWTGIICSVLEWYHLFCVRLVSFVLCWTGNVLFCVGLISFVLEDFLRMAPGAKTCSSCVLLSVFVG